MRAKWLALVTLVPVALLLAGRGKEPDPRYTILSLQQSELCVLLECREDHTVMLSNGLKSIAFDTNLDGTYEAKLRRTPGWQTMASTVILEAAVNDLQEIRTLEIGFSSHRWPELRAIEYFLIRTLLKFMEPNENTEDAIQFIQEHITVDTDWYDDPKHAYRWAGSIIYANHYGGSYGVKVERVER